MVYFKFEQGKKIITALSVGLSIIAVLFLAMAREPYLILQRHHCLQKNLQSGVRRNLTVWMLISMHRKYIIENFAMYTESQVHTGKGVQNREQRIS